MMVNYTAVPKKESDLDTIGSMLKGSDIPKPEVHDPLAHDPAILLSESEQKKTYVVQRGIECNPEDLMVDWIKRLFREN